MLWLSEAWRMINVGMILGRQSPGWFYVWTIQAWPWLMACPFLKELVFSGAATDCQKPWWTRCMLHSCRPQTCHKGKLGYSATADSAFDTDSTSMASMAMNPAMLAADKCNHDVRWISSQSLRQHHRPVIELPMASKNSFCSKKQCLPRSFAINPWFPSTLW